MKLYPFQEEGMRYLFGNRRAYLADDMGLGKTPQAIVAARQVQPERTAILCPAIAVPMWEKRWKEWDGPGVPFVRSYSKLVANPSLAGTVADADLLILDEAHYLKSLYSKRSRFALTLANRAPWVWLLSGTPTPNHPGELYTVLLAVWPDLLREYGIDSYMAFLSRFTYFRPTEWGPKVYGARNVELLREIIGNVMLRRRLQDVALDLPPLRWESFPIEARGPGMPELDALGPDLITYGELPAESPYVATTRRLIGEYKAPFVAELLASELRSQAYEKIVVLAYHRSVLDILEPRLTA